MDRLLSGDDEIDWLLGRFEVEINADPKSALRTSKQILSLAQHRQGIDAWRASWRGYTLAAQAYRRLSRMQESRSCIGSASQLILRTRSLSISDEERDLAWCMVLLRKAFLAKDLGDPDLASSCLDEQREHYERLGAPYLGRNLIDQAIVIETGTAGWQKVAAKTEEGLELLEEEGGPTDVYRTTALALHLYAVCEEPQPDKERLLKRVDDLQRLQDDDNCPLAQASFDWISGRALMCAGQCHEGETRLEGAVNVFTDYDQPIRAARAALDLAFGYMASGDQGKARELAGRVFPILGRLRYHKGAAAALIMYCNAAAQGTLTLAALQKLRRRLERAT